RLAAASLARGLPHPRSVIDRAASGTTVTWALGPGSPPPEQVAEVRIWNKSITRAVAVDPATAQESSGRFPGLSARDALGTGVDLGGTFVADTPLGRLVAVDGPLTLGTSVS